MTKEPELVAIFVRVPRALRKSIRQEAADEDRSMSQVVTSALRMYFKRPKAAGGKR